MPYFDYDGDINVNVDDFINACSSSEIKQLIQTLVEDGHLPKNYGGGSAVESEFEEALNKLHGKWNRLTREEEEIIIKISKRF